MLKRLQSNHINSLMVLMMAMMFVVLMTQQIFLVMVVSYLMVGTLLSVCVIDTVERPSYGQLLFTRGARKVSKCFLKMSFLQVILTLLVCVLLVFNMNLKDVFILYNIVNLLVFAWMIRCKLTMKFYSKGILYKGIFFHVERLKEGYIVKNYDNEYELYLNRRKVKLVLTKEELEILHSLQAQSIA